MHGIGANEPILPNSINSKPWVDPAPTPTDPTDPRDPRPPSPMPYPEPSPPIPIPIAPDVRELLDIIKSLKSEIQSLQIKVLELEAKLDTKTSHKSYGSQQCDQYVQLLRKAIIKLIKIDKDPDLSSRNVDRILFSRLFRAGLLESIPPYHGKIKGNLQSEISCKQ